MPINTLIFDFDGLILDTETPEYLILQDLFRPYGLTLPIEEWAKALGASPGAFDPFAYLAQKASVPLDQASLRKVFLQRSLDLIDKQPPLPGVTSLLDQADRAGMSLAVASSSPASWVHRHLRRLGLFDRFASVLTRDDVMHAKPHPELYLRTLEVFGINPHQAIVFEDSPNGISAARAAQIFCVAVPNHVTRLLDTGMANLTLTSLEELSLQELISRVNQARQ